MMLPNSHITQNSTELTSILQQLQLDSLNEICTYDTQFIAERFDETQLNTLNNALRSYLWKFNLLPVRMKELNQCYLPIEVLGLAPHIQASLINDGVHIVTEFIQRDRTDHLTIQWPIRDRLAVRTRIFCLLTLTTEQLDHLKLSNIPTPPTTSTDSSQDVIADEQINIERRFRAIPPTTREVIEFSDEFEDSSFLHKPWLRDWLPDDFCPSYPEIVKFLFDDVYQLPIATSRRHEIWAGAQMKATEHLEKIVKNVGLASFNHIFVEIYKQINANWQRLENLCIENQLPVPNLVLWTSEILMVRKDFYNTSRSRFRHFIKNIESSNCDQEIIDSISRVAFDSFELFWMLPDSALKFARERSEELNESLPSEEEFEEWLEVSADLTPHNLEVLLKQGLTARNNLVSGYFRSVLRFTRNYVERFKDVDYLDLVQEGAIGLITAADKFEYRASGRFITYATSWIWQITERSISDQTRSIRVPIHRYEQFKQLEKAYQECLDNDLEMPEAKDLCQYMEFLNSEEISKIREYQDNSTPLTPKVKERWDKVIKNTQHLLEYIEPTLSISAEIPPKLVENNLVMVGVETPISLGEVIYDQQSQLDDKNIVTEELKNFIFDLYADLPPRRQQIINLRFGLEGEEEHTLEEIGQLLGLTRERIRQLEKKALEHLAKNGSATKKELEEYFAYLAGIQSSHWPSEFIDYIRKHYSYWSELDSFESATKQDWQRLDALIEGLPGLDWHQRSPDTISRKTQVEGALKALNSPAHYRDITEQLNDILANSELDENYIYTILIRNEDTFVLLGEGIFSLNEWEQQRSLGPEPVLPFCPLPLPDLPAQNDTFLESVLIAQDYLKRGPKVSEFLMYMLRWAGSETSLSTWLKQSILNAYYLVGLIPYTFHIQGNDPVLTSRLPLLDLSELRRYCLRKLTERLVAMPEFWWIVRQYQPGNSSAFARHFVGIHPLELNDVTNRLKFLTSLGAMQRLPYSRYHLTSFGLSIAREWASQPDFSELDTDVAVELPIEEEFNILDLGLW